MSIPLIDDEVEMGSLRVLQNRQPEQAAGMLAFYSSHLRGITRDPALMSVPIDDHLCHRGHAVFDTANVCGGECFGLDFHLDRLIKSAGNAKMPLGPYNKESLRKIILATLAVAGKRDGVFVRYWFSVGRGDFSVSPKHCLEPSFFVVVHGAMTGSVPAGVMPGKSEMKLTGVKEYFVSVPTKPKLLANIKSNNYMINALCCMESSAKGGYLGIQIDQDGNVAEGAVANIAIITKEKIFRTPHFDNILAGTTVRRCFAIGEQMVKQGTLRKMEFATLKPDDVRNAEEVISLGGGHIVPVIAVDDKPIGTFCVAMPLERGSR
mmetsp:Transcript_10550/g.16522  ORF Transcript_10550/g.16522 Transcript_10550/m.16522 type:complete len:321 (+) Transcript_10550:139-1101(+)